MVQRDVLRESCVRHKIKPNIIVATTHPALDTIISVANNSKIEGFNARVKQVRSKKNVLSEITMFRARMRSADTACSQNIDVHSSISRAFVVFYFPPFSSLVGKWTLTDFAILTAVVAILLPSPYFDSIF